MRLSHAGLLNGSTEKRSPYHLEAASSNRNNAAAIRGARAYRNGSIALCCEFEPPVPWRKHVTILPGR